MAGTGWWAVCASRTFLTAIGMDHVLTSIALGPSRRPTRFPLRSYKLALRTVPIFSPLCHREKPRRSELQRKPGRCQDRRYSLGAWFLFCRLTRRLQLRSRRVVPAREGPPQLSTQILPTLHDLPAGHSFSQFRPFGHPTNHKPAFHVSHKSALFDGPEQREAKGLAEVAVMDSSA
jgi:hypothetical protein